MLMVPNPPPPSFLFYFFVRLWLPIVATKNGWPGGYCQLGVELAGPIDSTYLDPSPSS